MRYRHACRRGVRLTYTASIADHCFSGFEELQGKVCIHESFDPWFGRTRACAGVGGEAQPAGDGSGVCAGEWRHCTGGAVCSCRPEGRWRDGAAGGGGAAEPDDCGAGAAAVAGRGGCVSGARLSRVWADARCGAAGVEQGVCQAVHEASPDSDGQLCGVYRRGGGGGGDQAFPSAGRGEGRWTGCGQGRDHMPDAPVCDGGCARALQRRAAGALRKSRS